LDYSNLFYSTDFIINRFDSFGANLLVFKVFFLFSIFWYYMYNIVGVFPHLYHYHEILLSLNKNKG